MDHQNVIGFLGILDDPNRLCIVTPWMDGGELNAFLKRSLGSPRAPLACQIAAGLGYLRSQCIIHGDLKGANILIDEHRNAHISDFGCSYTVSRHNHSRLPPAFPLDPPERASTCGSCRWMAPELLLPPQFNSRATFESDVFAFGMVMYEILAGGEVPFLGKSDIQAALAILSGQRPDKPQNTPLEIWTLTCRCWEQEAADRLSINSILIFMSTYRSCSLF
ncbi:kinase-like domain-containing protein [Mycena sanguinolenta]|nr:kinase-like domain-containing protein [Mycena sanguinolenta]